MQILKIAVAVADLWESAPGYKRTLWGGAREVRFSPDSRHSLADVRYRADFVRFTPESRRGSGKSRESEVDPEQTLGPSTNIRCQLRQSRFAQPSNK